MKKLKKETTTDYLDFTYWEMKPKDRLKLDVGNIYDNKIECKLCHWIIRSKNRHNMVSCKCGAISVDGGSWYSKQGGSQKNIISHIKLFKYKHK